MSVEIILNNQIGICGIEKSKGIFIKYYSGAYGNIELQYFKSSNDNKYYYLIDNNNISYFGTGKNHNDIMVIHSKVEKIINAILELKDYTEIEKLKNNLFKYKKYDFDGFNLNRLYIELTDNIAEIKKYIIEF